MGEYKRGYLRALTDFEERLDNSIANEGGIHYGDKFIERVHWDHELRDQINELRAEVTNDQD